MRSPTGAEPAAVRAFGSPADGTAVVTGDHLLGVPLDHADPGSGSLTVYAREVRAHDLVDADQPYLLFFQGGPGCRSPRIGADLPGWLPWALRRYRVLLLDQRGTGRSTPADRLTLARLGDPQRQADHLRHLRADAIVADAEALRAHLLGDAPWTVLGQSFGGFCTWTYLGAAPEGLTAAFVTGGIPPVGAHPDEVYRATTRAVARRVADLDAAHPEVRVELARIARHLELRPEHLPTGERLTVPRLQEIGQVLGGAPGVDALANLVDEAWAMPGEALSDTFLAGVQDIVSFARQPLYALIHEACYAENGIVTGWSAQRVRDEIGPPTVPVADEAGGRGEVLPLTGEMIYPATVRSDPALRDLAAAADLLAERAWHEPLYDLDRLATCTVPVAAQLYTRDFYVAPELSRATAARTGTAPGGRPVSVLEDDVRHHDGLRRSGPEILDQLAEALGDAVPRAHPEPGGGAGAGAGSGGGSEAGAQAPPGRESPA